MTRRDDGGLATPSRLVVPNMSRMGELLDAAREGRDPNLPLLKPSLPEGEFQFDGREKGWELVEDVGFNPVITSVEELELVDFIRNHERDINSEALIKRAVELNANLGQRHMEWLLDREDQIPSEWEDYFIPMTGTLWSKPDAQVLIPCMHVIHGSWHMSWWALSYHWSHHNRLIRPRLVA